MWTPLRLTAEDHSPRVFAAIVLLIFVAGTLFVAVHHEPWRDEADAWLAARDLPLTQMLPDWTAHAGTPVLWYLILKTIVHSGLPYFAETVANLILIWAAAAVLLWFAPLTRTTKILLLASYFFAYEYAVIARSYSLAILLIFLAAALGRRPIAFAICIALLFNVSVHGALMGGFLAIACGGGRPRPPRRAGALAATLIIAIGGLLALWQLWPRGRANPLAMRGLQSGALTALRDIFIPSSTSSWTALISIAILILIALAIRQKHRALFFLIASIAGLVALYTLVWFGGLRASGMMLVAVVTAIWIAADVPVTTISKVAAVLLNITLAISAIFSFNIARADVNYAFSGSKEMAQFIDHSFDDYEIAAHNFYSAEALLPYLPQHRFFYIGLGERGTYLKWDAAMREGAAMRYEVAVFTAKQHYARTGAPWLLLLNSKMPSPEIHGFQLVHATPVIVFRNLDERYWLYKPLQTSH